MEVGFYFLEKILYKYRDETCEYYLNGNIGI